MGLFTCVNPVMWVLIFLKWDQSCAFIWAMRVRISLTDLPPKLPPKGFGTGQHDAAPLCTHGTKSVLSLGTQYHQTQQNNILTHKLWISHNPEVAGSSPVPATTWRTVERQVLPFFFFFRGNKPDFLFSFYSAGISVDARPTIEFIALAACNRPSLIRWVYIP